MAARRAGVSYTTVKRYAAEFPSVKDAVQEAKESMLDFTEGKLFEKISKGDTTCIIFFLKTQGKGKGYVERQEISGEGGGAVRHVVEVVDKVTKDITEDILKGKGTE